jgi:hypothetical protein
LCALRVKKDDLVTCAVLGDGWKLDLDDALDWSMDGEDDEDI